MQNMQKITGMYAVDRNLVNRKGVWIGGMSSRAGRVPLLLSAFGCGLFLGIVSPSVASRRVNEDCGGRIPAIRAPRGLNVLRDLFLDGGVVRMLGVKGDGVEMWVIKDRSMSGVAMRSG